MTGWQLALAGLRYELMHLWTDLDEAMRYGQGRAANATGPENWSMKSAALWDRIAMLTHLVGPCPIEEMPYSVHHLADRVPPADADNLSALYEAAGGRS